VSATKRSRKDPPKPRYQQLAEELRGGILRGTHGDPSQFPTESELCERYGVSRFTVREALRALQMEGLIHRRRGSGTFIQPASARGGALHQPLSNLDEILQYAQDSRFHFTALGMAVLPRQLAVQIGVAPGGRWYRFHGLRTRAGQSRPIATTEAYVHRDLEAAARRVEPAGATIFRQLERLADIRIMRATQDIQAVAATRRIAAELGVAPGSPCLKILRCYLDARGRIVELSASHHPGSRFVYSMHMEAHK
jgi:DNA-binding GntR family transcriptional regulator